MKVSYFNSYLPTSALFERLPASWDCSNLSASHRVDIMGRLSEATLLCTITTTTSSGLAHVRRVEEM